jgi:MFS family permease
VWTLAAPRWASRLDAVGARRMVLLGLVGFSISLAVCGVALTLGLYGVIGGGFAFFGFMFGRVIYGYLGAAAPPAAQAIIASRTTRAQRTEALSMLASAFGLGTILGPALAPFLVLPLLGLAGPAYLFALAGVAVLVLVSRLLSVAPSGERVHGAAASEPSIGGQSSGATVIAATTTRSTSSIALRDPRIWPWMVVGLVSGHAQAAIGQTMAFLVMDRLGLPPAQALPMIGTVLMVGASAALLAQWGIIPRLHLNPYQLVLWGTAIAAIGTFGVAAASDLHAIAVSFALASLGFGFLRPGFTAGSSLAVGPPEQGAVAGRVTAISGVVFVLGPSLGIVFYEIWRPLPYLASAVALALLAPYVIARLKLAASQP